MIRKIEAQELSEIAFGVVSGNFCINGFSLPSFPQICVLIPLLVKGKMAVQAGAVFMLILMLLDFLE